MRFTVFIEIQVLGVNLFFYRRILILIAVFGFVGLAQEMFMINKILLIITTKKTKNLHGDKTPNESVIQAV